MRHVQKRKSASHANRHTIFLFYRTLSPRMAKSTPCETHSLNRISKRTGRKNEKVHAHVRRFETFASRRVLDTPRSDRKKNKGKGLRFLEGSEKIVLLLFVVRTLENCITSVVDAIFWLLLSSPLSCTFSGLTQLRHPCSTYVTRYLTYADKQGEERNFVFLLFIEEKSKKYIQLR